MNPEPPVRHIITWPSDVGVQDMESKHGITWDQHLDQKALQTWTWRIWTPAQMWLAQRFEERRRRKNMKKKENKNNTGKPQTSGLFARPLRPDENARLFPPRGLGADRVRAVRRAGCGGGGRDTPRAIDGWWDRYGWINRERSCLQELDGFCTD